MDNKRIMVPIKVPRENTTEEIAIEIDYLEKKVLMSTMRDYVEQDSNVDIDQGKVIFTFEQFNYVQSLVSSPDTAKVLYGRK